MTHLVSSRPGRDHGRPPRGWLRSAAGRRVVSAGAALVLVLGVGTVAGAADVLDPDSGSVSASAAGSSAASRAAAQVALARARVNAAKTQVRILARQRESLERKIASGSSSIKTFDAGLKVTRAELPRAQRELVRSRAAVKRLKKAKAKSQAAFDKAEKAAAKADAKARKRATAAKSAGSAESAARKKATKVRKGKSGQKALASWQMAAVAETFAAARKGRALELSFDSDVRLEKATARLDLTGAKLANSRADVSAGKRSIQETKTAISSLSERRAEMRHSVKAWKKSLRRVVASERAAKNALKVLKARLAVLEKASGRAGR